MKREGLLFGPWSEKLPSYANVDSVGKPTTRIDFSEPVDGMEAPWGMAQLTFQANSARVPALPTSMAELHSPVIPPGPNNRQASTAGSCITNSV